MESNRSNESKKDQARSSASIGQGKSYVPYEKEKKNQSISKYIAATLLTLILGGAGAYIYKNYDINKKADFSKVTHLKSELVTSILALSDDNHKDHEAYVTDSNGIDRPRVTPEEIQKKQERAKKAIESHISATKDDPSKSSLGLYKGILSKCYIDGHDVHWIDENGSILSHVLQNSPLDQKGETARGMINQSSERIIVIMYEKGYEVYASNGELLKSEKH